MSLLICPIFSLGMCSRELPSQTHIYLDRTKVLVGNFLDMIYVQCPVHREQLVLEHAAFFSFDHEYCCIVNHEILFRFCLFVILCM